LTWYIGAACFLFVHAHVPSAHTHHPAILHWGVLLPVAFGFVAHFAGEAALDLARLPPTHRVFQS
jgi:hypothetical protein